MSSETPSQSTADEHAPIKSISEFAACIGLSSEDQSKIAPEYVKALTEQYKVLVDSADKTSTRRQAANTLFIALNGALLTVASVLLQRERPGSDWHRTVGWIAWLSAGLGMCWAWRSQVRSFRTLNKVKYEFINTYIEPRLPASIFRWEWSRLQNENYSDLSAVEGYFPLVFAGLHFAVVVIRFARG